VFVEDNKENMDMENFEISNKEQGEQKILAKS
jgi:hypothetical protein